MKGIIGWTMEKDNDGTNTKKKSHIAKKKIRKGQIETDKKKPMRRKKKCPPMKGIIGWTKEKDDGTNKKKDPG